MPQGLQVFRPDGRLRVDTSRRLGRVIGVVHIGTDLSGSFSSGAFSTGAAFAVFCPAGSSYNGYVKTSVNGNTLNWWKDYEGTYFKPNLADITGYLVVGVY